MPLRELSLRQFRNFTNLQVGQIDSGINLIVAPNGSGKSNLLEAIFLLATGFSPRTNRLREAIMWNEKSGRVEGLVNHQHLAITISNSTKKYYLGEKEVSLGQFLPKFQAVLFQPTDLNLLAGSPRLRRIYLDRVLTQLDYEYLYSLAVYRKLLTQKNYLLHQTSFDAEYLNVLETKLAELIVIISRKRHAGIDALNNLLRDQIELEYLASPRLLQEQSDADPQTLRELVREKIRELREKERTLGFALIGPQRDDWLAETKDPHSPTGKKNTGRFGSRGQQRMAILAIKLAESTLLEQKLGSKPSILWDDVLSELDADNQNQLLNSITNHQVFITTTDNKKIPAQFQHNSRIQLN